MRSLRYLAPGHAAGERSGIYHCVSRVVDRRMAFEREEKEWFAKLMRMYERFCGVRVLAFCVMSNHVHVLVEIPPRPEEGISDEELLARLGAISSIRLVEEVREWIQQRRESGDLAGLEELRERYLYRMWNLSEFMKSLKQRFTQWFNKKHDRTGTLWESTFRSVVVEDGYALRVIAAYIDLNPVRAGIVKRPEEYRWCSYAEALAGRKGARAGIERVMSKYEDFFGERPDGKRLVPWRSIVAAYRVILFSDGEERRGNLGAIERKGMSAEEAAGVKAIDGQLSAGSLLKHRMRHFSEGMAIGSKAFVEELFRASRERFGPKRTTGARKIRGHSTQLFSLRDLRGS